MEGDENITTNKRIPEIFKICEWDIECLLMKQFTRYGDMNATIIIKSI